MFYLVAKKVIVLAGDFRQVVPVEKRGSHAQIVATTLKHSHLWKYIQQRKLTENICVLSNGSDEELLLFDEWLLHLGNGELPHGPDNIIQLPSNMCILINSDSVVDSQFKLIDWVYPDLLFRYSDCEWMAERAILAPKSTAVDDINTLISKQIPGEFIIM